MRSNRISQAQAQALVPDRKHLHGALTRCGFHMPPLNDPICSKKFMLGVKCREFWVIRSDEIVALKTCADPPTRKDLAVMLADVMENLNPLGDWRDVAIRKTAERVRLTTPTKQWMLLVLSSLHPGHEVFDKGYIKPARRQEEQFVASAMVDNEDGFFDGLPMATPTGKRRINLLSADMQQQVKVARLQFQLGKLQEKLDRAQGVEQAGPSQ